MGVLHSSASDERPDWDVKWVSYCNKLYHFVIFSFSFVIVLRELVDLGGGGEEVVGGEVVFGAGGEEVGGEKELQHEQKF